MKRMILIEEDSPEFTELFRTIIREELNPILRQNVQEVLLSPKETCALFQPAISRVTLNNWTKQGKLTAYRMGSRVYYKRSEVLSALTHLQRYKKS